MKITIEVVLKEINDKNEPVRYCALTLDNDEPELYEKIKDHIEVFKHIVVKYPTV